MQRRGAAPYTHAAGGFGVCVPGAWAPWGIPNPAPLPGPESAASSLRVSVTLSSMWEDDKLRLPLCASPLACPSPHTLLPLLLRSPTPTPRQGPPAALQGQPQLRRSAQLRLPWRACVTQGPRSPAEQLTPVDNHTLKTASCQPQGRCWGSLASPQPRAVTVPCRDLAPGAPGLS